MAAAAVGVAATVGVASLASDPPGVCEGIGRNFGGCDAGQPSFSASDCSSLGAEAGRQIDARVSHVLRDGPDADESIAVEVFQAQALVVGRANQFSRQEGLECSPDAVLEGIEGAVSDEFKAIIGTVLYDDGMTHTYAEWRAEMRSILAVFEPEPD